MKKSIFKSIDDFIGEQAIVFRSSSIFTQISDIMRSFSEKEQLLINQISSVFLIILPTIALIVLVFVRFQSQSELQARRSVLNKMLSIKSITSELSSKEKSLVSPEINFEEKKEFNDMLVQLLEARKINSSNIIVNRFEILKESGTLKLIETEIKFKDLTSIAFTNLLLEVQTKFKASIDELETNKDTAKLLLGGSFKMSFFSKVER